MHKEKDSKENYLNERQVQIKKKYWLTSFIFAFIFSFIGLYVVNSSAETENSVEEKDDSVEIKSTQMNVQEYEEVNIEQQQDKNLTTEPQSLTPQQIETSNDTTISLEKDLSTPDFPYNENIPLPMEHQNYLYELCEEYGVDYYKALAVIQHESFYDPNVVSSTNDYGYFQINKVNHDRLAKATNTPNKPLDPYVNIQWGIYMLNELYDYWSDKGIKGEQLDVYVWSSYNKGLNGFKKYGEATTYVQKVKVALNDIKSAFNEI